MLWDVIVICHDMLGYVLICSEMPGDIMIRSDMKWKEMKWKEKKAPNPSSWTGKTKDTCRCWWHVDSNETWLYDFVQKISIIKIPFT